MNLLNSYQRARILLLTGSVLCFVAFWWTAKTFHIPPYPGYQASILVHGPVVLPFVIIAVVMAVCVLVGTAVAGMVRFNAGLLTATLGLAALSARGGEPRHTVLSALSLVGPGQMYLRFFAELFLLSLMIGAAWWVLRMLYTAGKLRDRETAGMREGEGGDITAEISSLAAQFMITALGIMLIAQSEAKQQAMAAIFIASFGGSAIAHTSMPTGPRSWYWLPPLLVGLFGFLLAYFITPQGLMTAEVRGAFAGLYRPMPLDYASMGPAGAIIGHWMSRRWQRDRDAAQSAAA
ncbi:MAG TPA: hypothetical protein VGQ99_23695 [Tepidisphaeraceae bacterium]|jgi:hypothetical protein|nr:hypothetical protein [Tepidisphaeraceae bacterium]